MLCRSGMCGTKTSRRPCLRLIEVFKVSFGRGRVSATAGAHVSFVQASYSILSPNLSPIEQSPTPSTAKNAGKALFTSNGSSGRWAPRRIWCAVSRFLMLCGNEQESSSARTCVQLPGAAERNPIVLATFKANAPPRPDTPRRRKRVLYYGHYDVVSATASERWTHDPWKMSGQNGWLYGRGVTDNKGPILAVAAAASDLRRRQELEVDLVMTIEGEEETGSAGFQEAIRSHRVRTGC